MADSDLPIMAPWFELSKGAIAVWNAAVDDLGDGETKPLSLKEYRKTFFEKNGYTFPSGRKDYRDVGDGYRIVKGDRAWLQTGFALMGPFSSGLRRYEVRRYWRVVFDDSHLARLAESLMAHIKEKNPEFEDKRVPLATRLALLPVPSWIFDSAGQPVHRFLLTEEEAHEAWPDFCLRNPLLQVGAVDY